MPLTFNGTDKTNLGEQTMTETDMKTRKYSCEFSSEQLRTIIYALDLFSRIKMGQIEEVAHIANCHDYKSRYELEESLKELKHLLGLKRHAHLGIYHEDCGIEAHRAWDIQQTLRRYQAWDECPQGGCTVDFDPVLPALKEALPTIKRVDETDPV